MVNASSFRGHFAGSYVSWQECRPFKTTIGRWKCSLAKRNSFMNQPFLGSTFVFPGVYIPCRFFFLRLSTQTHSANKNQQILVDGQWRMHPIKTIGMVLDQFIGIFTTNSMRFKLTVLFLVGGHLILEKVTVRSLNHPKKVTKNCQIAFEMVPFQVTFVHFQGGWG